VHVAGVKVQPVRALVGSEEEVDLSIAVKVTGADASTVIEVHVIEYVEVIGRMEGIAEVQSCPGLVQYSEGGMFGMDPGLMGAAEGKAQQG
jgi:hypothetical protein